MSHTGQDNRHSYGIVSYHTFPISCNTFKAWEARQSSTWRINCPLLGGPTILYWDQETRLTIAPCPLSIANLDSSSGRPDLLVLFGAAAGSRPAVLGRNACQPHPCSAGDRPLVTGPPTSTISQYNSSLEPAMDHV